MDKQTEKRRGREAKKQVKQKSKEAEKQRSSQAGKSRKAEKQSKEKQRSWEPNIKKYPKTKKKY